MTTKHTKGILISVKGKPFPQVIQHGNWYAVSDNLGGYYNPMRDAWQPQAYTFASEDLARAALEKAGAL
jgi:hypothetical protein